MFKLEFHPYVYYFDDEILYDRARDYYKNHPSSPSSNPSHLAIMALSGVCIDTNNTLIKNRGGNLISLIEGGMVIEEPRKELTVVVRGHCGSGKTRVAALISKLLAEEGFMTRMEFKEEREDDLIYVHVDSLVLCDGEPKAESIQYHLTQAAFIARKNGNDFLANVLLTMVDSL